MYNKFFIFDESGIKCPKIFINIEFASKNFQD